MNLIDFTQNGGYRLKQASLSKMQVAYFEILKAFITFLKVPDTGNYIISGCEISGANITSGIMYIDGELCPFVQTAGDLTTKIKKDIQIDVLAFKSGSNLPVFRQTTAIVDASGIALQDYIRVPEIPQLPDNLVIDANYVHTDNNFTDLFWAKLNGIEAGAEVNVQADWNVTNALSDAFIKNKPNITQWYHKGTASIGHIGSVALLMPIPISFPDIGVSDYFVVGFVRSTNNVAVIFAGVFNKTPTGFNITLHKPSETSTALNCEFDYYLLPTT